MNIKLTYEEWVEKYCAPVSEVMVEDLKEYHGLDAVGIGKLVDEMRRADYDFYINGGFEKSKQ